MPRRKQGQTKDITTDGCPKKKPDNGTELIQNESLKRYSTKNDLVFKIKKTMSSTNFNSAHNGKSEKEQVETTKSLNDDNVVNHHEVTNNLMKGGQESENSPINETQSTVNVSQDGTSEISVTSDNLSINTSSFVLNSLSPVNKKIKKGIVVYEKEKECIEMVSQKMAENSCNANISELSKNTITLSTIVENVNNEVSSVNGANTISNINENLETKLVNEKQKDLSPKMSGVSPVMPFKDNQMSKSEPLMNYRLSTSITNNHIEMPKEMDNYILKNKQNCHLPSSVYGISASNIEKVLTGLQMPGKKENGVSSSGKTSFLQEILEQNSFKNKSTGSIIEENKEDIQENKNSNYLSFDDNLKNSLDCKSVKTLENLSPVKLKLNISDSYSNDDSNSSILSTESQKAIKFPKITSPQVLEQHISKIISENAAIVDTLDPMWSKRYLKQTNLISSIADSDIKKSLVMSKINKNNEENLAHSNSYDNSNHSKLQSALLGGAEDMHISQNSIISTSSISKTKPFYYNLPLNSSINACGKLTSPLSEKELEVKSTEIKLANNHLSQKYENFLKSKTSLYFDNEKYNQHPQNPEGSIIKDLLLKNKSKNDLKTMPNVENKNQTVFNCTNFLDDSKTTPIHFKCPHCSSEFSSKHLLDTHSAFCKKTQLTTLRDTSDQTSLMPISNAQNEIFVSDSLININGQDPMTNKNGKNLEKSNEDIGPILKKQLLLPLPKTPPMKKRKVSDPLTISYSPDINKNLINAFSHTSLEKNPLSPHRSRSQSVHLFGGEVQILDGVKTKKMKIKNNIHSAFSSLPNKLSNEYPFQKSKSILDEDIVKDSFNSTAVVVTIAQPVHNSGGTVTHVPGHRHTSTITPVVTLSNNIADEIKKYKHELITSKESLKNLPYYENLKLSSDLTKSTENSYPLTFSFSDTKDKSLFSYSSIQNASKFKDLKPDVLTSDLSTTIKIAFSPNKSYCSSIYSNDNSICDVSVSQVFSTNIEESNSNSHHIVPSVMFTPSSPTLPQNENDSPSSSSNCLSSEPSKKYLAPTRPNSLPLKKKPFTMVGSTLISPETPRPKKNCIQLYINGHAYTYLGLKCSTRSTYCCIYRPQPMFILQETNPKLSMYSNWQVVPAKEELSGLTPGQMISFYCSKQSKDSHHIMTTAKLGEPLIFTHSSYWMFRSKDNEERPNEEQVCSNKNNINHIETSNSLIEKFQNTSSEFRPRSESVITTFGSNKSDGLSNSADESLTKLDTDNTSDGDGNNSDDDDDDDDCQDDGTESLTDSSQPQPPKRVKIFEGGFKSNEDYTYVRGRGRGKYVCEECGIRCKKPSMLKKHIRTHTDLRPYKCRHCSFAFKTKGNLTKHMKSKAHHKKCTELGIVPVPTTTDDSQIDEEALAKQEQIEKRKIQFSEGEDADDDDDDDTDETEDECESDTSSMMASNPKTKTFTNGHAKKSDSQDTSHDENYDENCPNNEDLLQQAVEQEAAHSLLHLSAIGEPNQWPLNRGTFTNVISSGETDTGSLITIPQEQSILSPQYTSHSVPSNILSNMNTKPSFDTWTEIAGHRPRSYSADVSSSNGKELLAKYRLTRGLTADTSSLPVNETSEFSSKEQFARRYSISVAREARKSNISQLPEYNPNSNILQKWTDVEASDQPMDLSVSRDLSKCTKTLYDSQMPPTLIAENRTDVNVATFETNDYQLKSLPTLSSQIVTEYENSNKISNNETTLLNLSEEQSSFIPNPSTRSIFYAQDITISDNIIPRKESEITEDPISPDTSDYAACSPISPQGLDENSGYYSQDNIEQTSTTSEENPPTSHFQAEFIVPSTSSSGMEEGKCVCRICNKIFAKSSHLRLHVNIHYFERPFRCDNCAVSFRTKGHLQKHKRSVSHYNKVNMNLTFGTPTVDNPRPFKCADCKIAFRIHGHLAKHLRSKMHIMKLECLGKLPFGMYAEMERSGVSLNEIDTTDCNNSLESLQVMAQKLYQRDPRRMRWQGQEQIPLDIDSSTSVPLITPIIDTTLPLTESLSTAFDSTCSPIGLPMQTASNLKTIIQTENEVKPEFSEGELARSGTFPNGEATVSSLSQYLISQPPTSSHNPPRRTEGQENDHSATLHRSGTCHICGRLFKSAKFLQVHLYCDHPTWNPSSVNEGTLSNSSEPSKMQELTCDLCGKQFPNQKILQQHLLSHAQPRPFVCEVCDAGFTSSSSLVAHQATHQLTSSSISETRLMQLK